jgi:excinuclease UvrABC nuclease subunit
MTYIYSLEHPLTGEIRYIGKTRSLKQRYYSHIENYSNKRNKSHRTNLNMI